MSHIASYGYRARTRSKFSRDFRQHGQIALSTYLRTFKVGDIVDIKGDGRQQKGMAPFSLFSCESLTNQACPTLCTTAAPVASGTSLPVLLVLLSTSRFVPFALRTLSLVVLIDKVRNRIFQKRIHVRVEHVKHSKCRDDFLKRVKLSATAKKGGDLVLKRVPEMPAEGKFVNPGPAGVTTMTPQRYVLLL